ncbi:MAG: 30S ribosomal protein S5 [archaeon GB-1867-035]|nr:30S ribosomal protein S5 [Candidatus Culexmicrobium profundum]
MSRYVTNIEEWVPRTTLGRLVKEGKIVSIYQIYALNLPIMEPEIIDALIPDLKHEIIDISIVQKQTDAGEMSRFKVAVVIGNEDGLIGIGTAKAKQLRFAINKAIENAKLHVIPVKRGCGSWECSCNRPHSVPFKVVGKSGSVEITLIPAPRGVGLVAGDTAKMVLRLAGIQDVWTRTRGETRTTLNFAKATYNALKKTLKRRTVG